jgi:hypothetical protein
MSDTMIIFLSDVGFRSVIHAVKEEQPKALESKISIETGQYNRRNEMMDSEIRMATSVRFCTLPLCLGFGVHLNVRMTDDEPFKKGILRKPAESSHHSREIRLVHICSNGMVHLSNFH